MNQKDYYQALGVDRNATPEQIRQAYRKLAFQYHPDRNCADPAATERMKQINEAYATLSSPTKRREYDALREQYGDLAYDRFRQAHSPEDIFRGSDIAQVFEELARSFGFRSSEEIFREFYGPGFRAYEFRRPGQFGRAFVFYGRRAQPQAGQQAGPIQDNVAPVVFPGLLGRLLKSILRAAGVPFPERGKDFKDTISLSPEQAENGAEVAYAHTKSARPKDLMVKIRPGARNGQRIRLRGMGGPGKAGGEPGDLYLQVRIKTPLLQRLRYLLR